MKRCSTSRRSDAVVFAGADVSLVLTLVLGR